MIKNGTYNSDSLPKDIKNEVIKSLKNEGVETLLSVLPATKSFSYYFNRVSDEKIGNVLQRIFHANGKVATLDGQYPRLFSDAVVFKVEDKVHVVNEGFYIAFEFPLDNAQSQYVIDVIAYVLGGKGGWRDHSDFIITSPISTLVAVSAGRYDSQRSDPWSEVNGVLEDHLENGSPVRTKTTQHGPAGTRAVPSIALPEFKILPVNQDN